MPLPFLAWAAIAAVGGMGAVGHAVARDDQKEAESIARRAKRTYDDAKSSLESAAIIAESRLESLGRSKKEVYDTSMKRFMRSFERIQDIPDKNFPGMDELRNFRITPSDMIQLREMGSLYDGAFAAGAGAAAGAGFAALAANGSLSAVGSALMAGNIGTALTGLGGALTATPLAVIGAPVMFFTALSASFKADENKEKARAMLAEAESKAEKMKTDETFCRAVGERADMFRGLLSRLNGMFAPCVDRLEDMVRSKTVYDPYRKISGYELSDNQLALCAVTGSLAGAVKSVLDVPILSGSREIHPRVDSTITRVSGKLPALVSNFKRV
ncbi:MAG: hypothetical protein IJR63_00165 [Synergistaceae bacterium]|nr:hypothetical protein [Synergistaceae bacterium]